MGPSLGYYGGFLLKNISTSLKIYCRMGVVNQKAMRGGDVHMREKPDVWSYSMPEVLHSGFTALEFC